METERTSVVGTVNFRFNYKLTGAEVRPCQYAKCNYQPTLLSFALRAQTTDGTAPSYDDLEADGADLWGYKLKKDGSPGLAETKEHFYYSEYPEWVSRIIEAAALALREGV